MSANIWIKLEFKGDIGGLAMTTQTQEAHDEDRR
jgi:hypothetical protein